MYDPLQPSIYDVGTMYVYRGELYWNQGGTAVEPNEQPDPRHLSDSEWRF